VEETEGLRRQIAVCEGEIKGADETTRVTEKQIAQFQNEISNQTHSVNQLLLTLKL